jgi:prephenate dehydratase
MKDANAMIFGVSGDTGSFSEVAARNYLAKINKTATLKYLMDMEGVLNDIASQKIDLGIFPVVNLHGGLVRMAFDAMGNHQFKVIDELWLDVHQCLLVKPGTPINQIKCIVTHSQAIKQCRDYIEKNLKNVKCIDWQDTALAARDLGEGELDDNCAVIASKDAACAYGLEVIVENIEDIKPNLTAFIIVKNHGDL